MVHTSLKATLRTVIGTKSFFLIKIFGLAVGLASFVLISAYVYDDLTWDSVYKNRDRTYVLRIKTLSEGDPEPVHTTTTALLGPAVLNDIPDIESMSRYERCRNLVFMQNEQPIYEESAFLVDPGFLDIFSVEMLAGDPATAFDRPEAILLSESAASKYFGDRNPVGQQIQLGDGNTVQVTGVFLAPSQDSHIHYEILRPIQPYIDENYPEDSWTHGWLTTYVMLRSGTDTEKVNRELLRYSEQLDPDEGQTVVDLLPMKDIHLAQDTWIRHNDQAGNPVYTWMFGSAAALILLIAVVNYINLSTAQSLQRAREIGLRKVIGARRIELIAQLVIESVVLALFAALIAAILILLFKHPLEAIAGRSIGFEASRPAGWLLMAILAIFMGLLSGFYPAIILSGFKPIQTLKGARLRSPRISWLRRGLVGLQFAIAMILIIATISVQGQLAFMLTKDRGFDSKQVVSISLPPNEDEVLEGLRTRIGSINGVEDAGLAFSMPGRIDISFGVGPEGVPGHWVMDGVLVDEHCLPLFHFQLADGRYYSSDYPGDNAWEDSEQGSILINEEAARRLGWDNPVGKTMMIDPFKATVVGVVKDFHTGSLHDPIPATIIGDLPFISYRRIMARIDEARTSQILTEISSIMNDQFPKQPFRYEFADERYQRYYETERRSAKLLQIFSGMAILLTLLGIIGLTAHSASRRVREIGIRKVLGASLPNLISLLTKEVLVLIAFSAVIALPTGYWLSVKWLENFAFRIHFPLLALPEAVLITLILAGLSAGVIGWKAATVNPTNSLRSE